MPAAPAAPAVPAEAKCPREPPSDLPKPGEIKVYDFRTPETKAQAAAQDKSKPIKLLQWNIERGYKLPQVTALA